MLMNNSPRMIARERLTNVIYEDRTKDLIDNKTLELIKYDIFKSVSKYLDIEENNIKISFENHKNDKTLGALLKADIVIDNILDCLRKKSDD